MYLVVEVQEILVRDLVTNQITKPLVIKLLQNILQVSNNNWNLYWEVALLAPLAAPCQIWISLNQLLSSISVHECSWKKSYFLTFLNVYREWPRSFRGRGRQMGYNLFSGRNPETICWFDIWKELFTSSSSQHWGNGKHRTLGVPRPLAPENHKHSFK